jgi:hypothetical protein
MSHFANSILFYDLESAEYLFKVDMEEEGQNGVGTAFGYFIEDLDNIYLTSSLAGITKVDTSGTKKQFIEYRKTDRGFQLVQNYASFSYFYTPGIIYNGKIYITQKAYPGMNKLDVPVSVVIDTLKDKYEEMPFRFPDMVEGYSVADFSRDFNGKQFIYSFHWNENIYVIDIETNEEKAIPAKSKYINKLTTTKIPDDRDLSYKAFLESSHYNNLLYDKYRNVYYRFVTIGSEVTENPKYSFFDIYTNGSIRFSVIILDKDFNIIGETLFPKYTYHPSIAFVHKNGLYISDSHILNPSFDENTLSFKCFELKEINEMYPNGCYSGGNECLCYTWYPTYKEAGNN